jgi:hypothetical protein
VIHIKPGAKLLNTSGSLEIAIGYREIEIKKNTIGLTKDADFLEYTRNSFLNCFFIKIMSSMNSCQ